jgi:hypothetical protein
VSRSDLQGQSYAIASSEKSLTCSDVSCNRFDVIWGGGGVAMSLQCCKEVMKAGSTGSVIVVRRLGVSRITQGRREPLARAAVDPSNAALSA